MPRRARRRRRSTRENGPPKPGANVYFEARVAHSGAERDFDLSAPGLIFALLRGSSGTHESPGPIRSAWELSLAGTVVPDIWRPPYICRDPARSTVPTATAALSFLLAEPGMGARKARPDLWIALVQHRSDHRPHIRGQESPARGGAARPRGRVQERCGACGFGNRGAAGCRSRASALPPGFLRSSPSVRKSIRRR